MDVPLPTGHVSHPREHDDSAGMCPTTVALLSPSVMMADEGPGEPFHEDSPQFSPINVHFQRI